jgi:hypothetical protein
VSRILQNGTRQHADLLFVLDHENDGHRAPPAACRTT